MKRPFSRLQEENSAVQIVECCSALPRLDEELQKRVEEVLECVRPGKSDTATKIMRLGIQLYCRHTHISVNLAVFSILLNSMLMATKNWNGKLMIKTRWSNVNSYKCCLVSCVSLVVDPDYWHCHVGHLDNGQYPMEFVVALKY
ncbi:hypothetical protein INT43_001657 [Umbelopsis isabellina]|uniref:Uncharacterized protein n=1 Tax=Mortierella isabellina TaxID=91625 RepID=A0A8H7PRK0_MORIS|nr:hypothetical protein INT43_001657 [Umbelopsis isabellina]